MTQLWSAIGFILTVAVTIALCAMLVLAIREQARIERGIEAACVELSKTDPWVVYRDGYCVTYESGEPEIVLVEVR